MSRTPRWGTWNKIANALSGEFIMTVFGVANGGAAILARTLLVSVCVYLSAWSLKLVADPRGWGYGPHKPYTDLIDTLPWFGAIFAGTYAALYSRFSSQWSYLAGLYNQIKQVEAALSPNGVHPSAIVQLKAAFIEDAYALHLAGKPTFAAIIHAWWQDADVRRALVEHAYVPEHQKTVEHVGGLLKAKRGSTPSREPSAPSREPSACRSEGVDDAAREPSRSRRSA